MAFVEQISGKLPDLKEELKGMRNTVAAEEAQLQKKRAPEPAKRQEPTGPSAPNNHPSPLVAQNKEQSEIHGQISEAIVREEPNVKWEDVAET